MSKPITALNGATDDTGIATVTEMGPTGMITLRGDLTDKILGTAVAAAGGVQMPKSQQINTSETGGVAWMSPDELLIMCEYSEVADRLAVLQSTLKEQHALAVNVSDARAMFEVSGPHTREVIAKLAPVDMHPDEFKPGDVRRTRLAQVAAAFWLVDDTTAQIICFRSVGQYVFDLLNVASQEGSGVGHF